MVGERQLVLPGRSAARTRGAAASTLVVVPGVLAIPGPLSLSGSPGEASRAVRS
jgi:hypothetical protein